jgi:NitT/TauT family transport system ATP-binding protein
MPSPFLVGVPSFASHCASRVAKREAEFLDGVTVVGDYALVTTSGARTSTPKLVVRHVVKTFVSPDAGQEMVALDDVSLEAGPHEFICLLGPSGCGKTTLLNLIAGFLDPTEGELYVDDRVIAGASSDRGVVFQDYALFPWLTVHQNVQFGPRVLGSGKGEREQIADRYLAMVGLTQWRNRYPHQLSGGMKQRVAIARALANRPSILLLDEPFGALDAMTRETMQDELLALTMQEPKLVIFVTHSVLEAVFLADRIIVMSAHPGRIMTDIPVPLAHPRDRTAPDVTEYVREIRNLLAPQLREDVRESAAP